MGYEGLIAETITMRGHNGDAIEAYLARPLGVVERAGRGGHPPHARLGRVDQGGRAQARRTTATRRLRRTCFRGSGPGRWDDVGRRRARGRRHAGRAGRGRRRRPRRSCCAISRTANGKVGVIGFCSGGRQAYMVACKIHGIDAAVDCWGGRVIAKPEELNERQPVGGDRHDARDAAARCSASSATTTPARTRSRSTAPRRCCATLGKDYEFHRYDGAGHGFFATDRPNYRPEQAVDGWKKVFAFFERTLQTAPAREPALTA